MWPNSVRAFSRDLSAGLIAVLVWVGAAHAMSQAACSADRALFLTADGIQSFSVEVADDPAERERGLMFRKTLPQNHGMLFIYDKPRQMSFWMRNTLIPLDLIFLDASGIIRHIHRDAIPLDETPIPGASIGDPNPDRLMILEIGGGEAARLGLTPGQPMAYPRLDPEMAAWPCS